MQAWGDHYFKSWKKSAESQRKCFELVVEPEVDTCQLEIRKTNYKFQEMIEISLIEEDGYDLYIDTHPSIMNLCIYSRIFAVINIIRPHFFLSQRKKTSTMN